MAGPARVGGRRQYPTAPEPTMSTPTASATLPTTMRAAAIDGFGGPERLVPREVPVPPVGPDDVLIKVAVAGVGVWDAKERAGETAARTPDAVKRFPRVLGGEGTGVVVAVGAHVTEFRPGDAVYGTNFLSPAGGFYAEYAAAPAGQVSRLPRTLDPEQAATLAIGGLTAFVGLSDQLGVRAGYHLLVFGASGGVGLPAVQLAKAMGARVLGVVSGAAGAALVRQAEADAVADSTSGLADAIRAFAPDGLDGVLATVNGHGLDEAIAAVRPGGHVAYPTGVQPEPKGTAAVTAASYNGQFDRGRYDAMNALVDARPFSLPVGARFPLAEAAAAQQALDQHVAGSVLLEVA